jgi:hypothetical protein
MDGLMVKALLSLMGALVVCDTTAVAQQLWCWSIVGSGVSAAGTLVIGSRADAEGFYPITAITGTADSAAITALQPRNTNIPGNAGYPVDNLIRDKAPQLTKHGLGFVTSDGVYHNPFYMEQYRDYISRPPYANGKGAEPTIQFKATASSDSHCSTR